MAKKTKKQYEAWLNSIGDGLNEEAFILGGKMRHGKYGAMVRKHDPIGFSVGYNEWSR